MVVDENAVDEKSAILDNTLKIAPVSYRQSYINFRDNLKFTLCEINYIYTYILFSHFISSVK